MPARLIVNADDFGLTAGINRAVAELYCGGVLTSATLMAGGAAFEHAVALALGHPGLGVGCHIVLTDGVPVSAPADIPSLMAGDGRTLRPKLGEFVRALLAGRIREDDIATEALAQIRRVQRAGVRVTHVDSHKHTHLFPAVLRGVLRAAQEAGVGAIRSPFEPMWTDRLAHGSRGRRTAVRLTRALRRGSEKLVRQSGLRTTDGTLAISATGELTAATLRELLSALPQTGTYELCCHPGYNDHELDAVATRLRSQRDTEREALFTVIRETRNEPGAPELVHYGEVSSSMRDPTGIRAL